MRYLPLWVVAICIFLLWSTAFAADPAIRVKERELLNYITDQTGYRTEHLSPQYEFWTPEKINQVFYGERYADQDDVIALHLGGKIILPTTFSLATQPEVLLHELFHFAVFENDVQFECLRAEERAAYELQIKYVDEERDGVGLKPDLFFVYMQVCQSGYGYPD